jgi:hypothetical protein
MKGEAGWREPDPINRRKPASVTHHKTHPIQSQGNSEDRLAKIVAQSLIGPWEGNKQPRTVVRGCRFTERW